MSDSAGDPRDRTALEASERRLRTIVEGMPVLMDAYDEHGVIVAWNSECERVSGYTAAEIIGNPNAMEILYPDSRYRELKLEEAHRRRQEEYSSVWELTAKDGSLRTVEWFNVGVRLKIPGWLEWSIGIDITERRRLEDALREATLREQRRLGRELHDGLGQELTGLAMLATSLARAHAAGDPELAAELEQLSAIASQTIATCKNIARGLAPVTSTDGGLSDALHALTAELVRQTGSLDITYADESTAPLRVSLDTCNQLFRIVQEALSNAMAHADARLVRVRLVVDPQRVLVEVSDDGRGIASGPARRGGMGLQTMHDRATAIRGRLTVKNATGGGTSIRCECANRERDPKPRR